MGITLTTWFDRHLPTYCPWCGAAPLAREPGATITWHCPGCDSEFLLHPVRCEEEDDA
jgi:hypothetical protein